MNYFDFYNIPMSFFPDEAGLRKAFLLNSRKFHPDFHTLADEAQQASMLEMASANNEAFKTLTDPDLRIQHILQVLNALPEEGAAAPLDQAFLMEMMDINEAIMELEFDPNKEKLDEAIENTAKIEQNLSDTIKPVLQNWNAESPDQDTYLEKIKNYYFKRKYLLRIRENLSTFASAFEK